MNQEVELPIFIHEGNVWLGEGDEAQAIGSQEDFRMWFEHYSDYDLYEEGGVLDWDFQGCNIEYYDSPYLKEFYRTVKHKLNLNIAA